MTPKELMQEAVRILDRKKGLQITALQIADLTAVADYFVIVTGTSGTHIRALADTLDEELSAQGVEPDHIEGKSTGWILMDYQSVVVHIFTPQEREQFQLERLWGDAVPVDLQGLVTED